MTFECPFCPKKYEVLEEALHHLELDHIGMSSELLAHATKSLQTKKQLGDYVAPDREGTAFECPHCFDFFSDLKKLEEHGKTVHKVQFNLEFLQKLESMNSYDKNHPPVCDNCNKEFLGLITTKIDGTVKNVCFVCYEGHYGANALNRLTIGTPDDMIEKMRKPVR